MNHIILYIEGNCQGQHIHIFEACPNLGAMKTCKGISLHDTLSSFVILEGNWNFYQNDQYNSLFNELPLGPGIYKSLGHGIRNDAVTSLKPV